MGEKSYYDQCPSLTQKVHTEFDVSNGSLDNFIVVSDKGKKLKRSERPLLSKTRVSRVLNAITGRKLPVLGSKTDFWKKGIAP